MRDVLPGKWTRRPLADCAVWYSGGTPRKSNAEYWHGAIPWISAKSLKRFFIADSENSVTELGAKNGTRLIPKDSILFIVRGMSLKTEFRMGITTRPVTFNQDLKALIAVDGILPSFLAYAVKGRTLDILGLVTEAGHGTGVLPTDRIRSLELSIPPLPEQRRIAAVLGALDDKIELNRKMNQGLEAMAQALFKSWFVDYDPAIDNALRAGNPIPDDLQAKATRRSKVMARGSYEIPPYAKLFPDSFEDSELGSIPSGWRVSSVDELATVGSGKRQKDRSVKRDEAARYPLVGGAGQIGWTADYLLDEAALVTGRVGTLGVIQRWNEPIWPSDNALVIKTRNPNTYFLVYQHLRLIDFANLNRGSTQPLLTQRDLKSQRLLLPTSEILDLFCKSASIQFKKLEANSNESKTLVDLRDTLLPKLISGEVRVPASAVLGVAE